MTEDALNRSIQETLERERRRQPVTRAALDESTLDMVAYRTVFAALDEPPAFSLHADFADRVVVAVTPEPFPWFERVLLPLAIAGLTVATLALAISMATEQWADFVQTLSGARLDLLGVILLIAGGVWLKECLPRGRQGAQTLGI